MTQEELFSELFNLEETDKRKERVVFASLLVSLLRGEMNELLKEAPLEVCEEFRRIWDAHTHVSVGTIFQRPKFEEYEAYHRAAQYRTLN